MDLCEFKASLVYRESSRIGSKATQRNPVSKPLPPKKLPNKQTNKNPKQTKKKTKTGKKNKRKRIKRNVSDWRDGSELQHWPLLQRTQAPFHIGIHNL